MASTFEPDLTGTFVESLFHGHMNAMVVTDPNGRTPETVISMNDSWTVVVEWELHGTLIRSGLLGGTWEVQVVLESLGPGIEDIIARRSVNIATGGVATGLGRKYHEQFTFTPGSTPPEPGMYWLAAVITSVGQNGVPGPFAGYSETATLQFYHGENLPQ